MSQTWADDVYNTGHTVATDMQSVEDNFAALKSMFSGASAPSNPVAGMLWYDTTNYLMKIRNKDNNAWLSIYDVSNDRVYTDQVETASIKDLNVTTGKINDLAVTTGKINDLAVTNGKLADSAVTAAKITNGSISPAKLEEGMLFACYAAGNNTGYDNLTETTGWQTLGQTFYLWVPTGAVYMVGTLRGSSSYTTVYGRFCVGSVTSGSLTFPSSLSVTNNSAFDVSSVAGSFVQVYFQANPTNYSCSCQLYTWALQFYGA